MHKKNRKGRRVCGSTLWCIPEIVSRCTSISVRTNCQLKDEFPGKDIPRLPTKNRSSTAAPGIGATIASAFKDDGDSSDTVSTISENSLSVPYEPPPSPPATGPAPSPAPKQGFISHFRSASSPALHKQATSHDFHIPREKNRLTLRSFLRQIIRDKRLARSATLREFLLSDPIATLSREEEADIERRFEMDRIRLAEQKKFVDESRKRARELDQWLRGFKSDLIRNRRCLYFQTNG
jgi:hypothetical protein